MLNLRKQTFPSDILKAVIAGGRVVRKSTVNASSKGSSAQIYVSVRVAKTVMLTKNKEKKPKIASQRKFYFQLMKHVPALKIPVTNLSKQ